MVYRTISKLLWVILCFALAWLTAACQAGSPGTTQPPNPYSDPSPVPVVTDTLRCEQKLVFPEISEIQPENITPGKEVKIVGKGGYIQDTCGGYNESARSFILYLDQKPFLNLSCYVNHCEGKATLDQTITAGIHCLSFQQDGCEIKLQIEPK